MRTRMATQAKLVWRWILVLVALVASFLILWTARSSAPPAPDVALLETPLWRMAGALLLRAEAPPKKGLLLRHAQQGGVYRHDPGQRALTAASQEDWDAVGTPVRDCSTAGGNPRSLWVDPATHKLRDGTREIATVGAYALSLYASPSGNQAAVLSAEGPATRALLPFLSGGGAHGRHYHQIVRTEDGTPVGPALSLGFDSRHEVILGCWSPDERFIVYHDYLLSHLSIVHVNAVAERNSTDGTLPK